MVSVYGIGLCLMISAISSLKDNENIEDTVRRFMFILGGYLFFGYFIELIIDKLM